MIESQELRDHLCSELNYVQFTCRHCPSKFFFMEDALQHGDLIHNSQDCWAYAEKNPDLEKKLQSLLQEVRRTPVIKVSFCKN